jgi:Domain of unknown function (DUF4350)
MTRRRRWLLASSAVIAGIAIFALIAPPEGVGLSALDRFLAASGLGIQHASAPPPGGGTFVLLLDRRTSEQDAVLLAWVKEGGRLVVADPGSPLFARYGVSGRRAGIFGTTVLTPGCARQETLGVGSLEVSATDQVLSTSTPDAAVCFSQDTAGYAVFLPLGRGEVVLLGGHSFASDALLDHADDAVLAHGLFDAGGPVVFGPPIPPDTARHSVWGLIPVRGKAVIWELVIAAILFALARGRRIGRPVPEVALSPIPSGELVRAAARLYRRAGARAFCAQTLRRATIDRIARRLGMPPDMDRQRQADAIAGHLHPDDPAAPTVLRGPDPGTDQEFVALCRDLERFADHIEGAER